MRTVAGQLVILDKYGDIFLPATGMKKGRVGDPRIRKRCSKAKAEEDRMLQARKKSRSKMQTTTPNPSSYQQRPNVLPDLSPDSQSDLSYKTLSSANDPFTQDNRDGRSKASSHGSSVGEKSSARNQNSDSTSDDLSTDVIDESDSSQDSNSSHNDTNDSKDGSNSTKSAATESYDHWNFRDPRSFPGGMPQFLPLHNGHSALPTNWLAPSVYMAMAYPRMP